jgi:ankyrin repeat protein
MHEQDPTLISVRDNDGWTPLHRASFHGHLDVVKWLHEQDPSLVSVRSNGGLTPLHVASPVGRLDVLEWLLSKQPSLLMDVESRPWMEKLKLPVQYPLHFAVRDGCFEKVKSILHEEPHRIQEKDIWGKTPLHHAVDSNQIECIKFLIEGDVSIINCVDSENRDVFDIASEHDQSQDILDLLHITLIQYLCDICDARFGM